MWLKNHEKCFEQILSVQNTVADEEEESKGLEGADEKKQQQVSFKRALLNQTQQFFEENLIPPEGVLNASVKNEEAIEKEMKYLN